MSIAETKAGTGELPVIYMNGSVVPLAGHELVAALRNRYAVAMLVATVVLLSIPSGGGLLGDGPLWARVLINVAAVCAFLAVFPALLLDAHHRARLQGRKRVYLATVSVPSAMLATLSAEAFGVFLTDGSISRWGLVTKLGFGLIFWEAVVFLGIWFYGPVIGQPRPDQAEDGQDEAQLSIGSVQIDPRKLTRIETEGRRLHLHVEGSVQTVTARLKDVCVPLEPYGLLVHRCHWVAFDQLGPVSVSGRSYVMVTPRGDRVPVSRDRRDAVRAAQTVESRT